MLCRHCHQRRPNRPRGLCWHCYYTPGLREQYPSTSKYGRRLPEDAPSEAALPLPARPTDAAPGSPEKIDVLARRLRSGRQLFHPEDAPLTIPQGRRRPPCRSD